jgi:hypothetical protein
LNKEFGKEKQTFVEKKIKSNFFSKLPNLTLANIIVYATVVKNKERNQSISSDQNIAPNLT